MTSALSFQSWVLTNGGDLQFILFFTLFGILAIAEFFAPARNERTATPRRWLANVVLTVLNIGVMSFLPVTFFGASIWAAQHGIGLLNVLPDPFLVTFIAGLLLRGFISFFTHFLMHRVPLLWRVHRVHHLDTEMDISTTVRFHPLELLLNLLPGICLVVAFGLPPWVLLFYEVLDAGVTLFSHANISLPGRIENVLRYVIVTPDLHRVHHSSWQPETDSNFSAVFPIWDLVFRTFRVRKRKPQAAMTLGLDEVRDDRTASVGWLLASPGRRSLVDEYEKEFNRMKSTEVKEDSKLRSPKSVTERILSHRPPRVALGLLLVGWLLYLGFPDWRAMWVGLGLDAIIVAVVGLSIMMAAWFEFRRKDNPVCHTAQPIRLINSGPFRFSRNPMYLGMWVALWAPFLGTGGWAFLLPPMVFFVLTNWVIVPFEERRMCVTFEDEYMDYARRTRRWI